MLTLGYDDLSGAVTLYDGQKPVRRIDTDEEALAFLGAVSAGIYKYEHIDLGYFIEVLGKGMRARNLGG